MEDARHPPIHLIEPATQARPEAVVRLASLWKSFGAQEVLRGVNLAVPPGQTCVILGPSGSGKSVILKHIAGLLRPDKGEVHFFGVRTDTLSERQMAPHRRRMGYLFQQSALFDSMTVLQNLEFPLLEHSDLAPRARAERVAQALETVGLAGVQKKFPAELSGGQQKRVALARAIILRPALILYDEPTTGLDPERAAGISDLIRTLQQELHTTGIVVTHDLDCTRRVADRVLLLHAGRFVFDGTYTQALASGDERLSRFMAGHATAPAALPSTDLDERDLSDTDERARRAVLGRAS